VSFVSYILLEPNGALVCLPLLFCFFVLFFFLISFHNDLEFDGFSRFPIKIIDNYLLEILFFGML
jgi:hypothetical protein